MRIADFAAGTFLAVHEIKRLSPAPALGFDPGCATDWTLSADVCIDARGELRIEIEYCGKVVAGVCGEQLERAVLAALFMRDGREP